MNIDYPILGAYSNGDFVRVQRGGTQRQEKWAKLAATLPPTDWTVLSVPETNRDRRALLTGMHDGFGFTHCIRFPDRYELFKCEEAMAVRVLASIEASGSCPPNGVLRVGCGDNLHWLI